MRAFALAAATAALALVGVAEARTWTDPAGRVTFEAPDAWRIQQPQGTPEGMTYVVAGSADNECQVLAATNTNTAAGDPGRLRAVSAEPARFGANVWTQAMGQFTDVFSADRALQVGALSVDTTNAWPIQRAELRAGSQAAHGAIQMRPGVDIFAVCVTYGGRDPVATYDQVIRSIAHPNDAAWAPPPAAAAPAEGAAAPAPAH